jgi:hypothetical protein
VYAPVVPTDDPAITVDAVRVCGGRGRGRYSVVYLSDRCRRCGWAGETREHGDEPTLLDMIGHDCARRGEPGDPYPGTVDHTAHTAQPALPAA